MASAPPPLVASPLRMPTPRELQELAERLDWSALSDESLAAYEAMVVPLAQGYTQHEVAERLGISHGRVANALRRLRAEVQAQWPAYERTP